MYTDLRFRSLTEFTTEQTNNHTTSKTTSLLSNPKKFPLQKKKTSTVVLVPVDSFVNLLVFNKVSLLSEGFGTDITTERFLASMRPQMNLNIALIQKPSVTNSTSMNGLLLPTNQSRFRAIGQGRRVTRSLLIRIVGPRIRSRPFPRMGRSGERRVNQIRTARSRHPARRTDRWIRTCGRRRFSTARILQAASCSLQPRMQKWRTRMRQQILQRWIVRLVLVLVHLVVRVIFLFGRAGVIDPVCNINPVPRNVLVVIRTVIVPPWNSSVSDSRANNFSNVLHVISRFLLLRRLGQLLLSALGTGRT